MDVLTPEQIERLREFVFGTVLDSHEALRQQLAAVEQDAKEASSLRAERDEYRRHAEVLADEAESYIGYGWDTGDESRRIRAVLAAFRETKGEAT